MKKMLATLLAVLFTAVCHHLCAQDVITLKTGEDINVKVLEVGSADVKYKKSDNPDGPAYTVAKSDVFMIKYQNGSKDVFNTASEPVQASPNTAQQPANTNVDTRKEVETGIKNYQAQQDYEKNMQIYRKRLGSGIACTAIGVPFVITGAALVGVGVSYINGYNAGLYDYEEVDYEERGAILAAVGGVLVLTGIPLTIVGPIKIGTAFKYRRKAKEAKASLSFEPSIQRIAPAGNVYGTTTGLAMRVTF